MPYSETKMPSKNDSESELLLGLFNATSGELFDMPIAHLDSSDKLKAVVKMSIVDLPSSSYIVLPPVSFISENLTESILNAANLPQELKGAEVEEMDFEVIYFRKGSFVVFTEAHIFGENGRGGSICSFAFSSSLLVSAEKENADFPAVADELINCAKQDEDLRQRLADYILAEHFTKLSHVKIPFSETQIAEVGRILRDYNSGLLVDCKLMMIKQWGKNFIKEGEEAPAVVHVKIKQIERDLVTNLESSIRRSKKGLRDAKGEIMTAIDLFESDRQFDLNN